MSPKPPRKSRRLLSLAGRGVGFVVGLGLAYYFIERAGAARTLSLVRAAGGWLPLIVGLQLVIIACDVFALRHLVKDAPTPAPVMTWLRASAVANACAVFMPAGRPAGEALRAVALSSWIGAGRAARAGARLQGVSLLANAVACAVAGGLASLVSPLLGGLLGIATLIAAGVGGATFLIARSTRVAAYAGRLAGRFLPAVALRAEVEGSEAGATGARGSSLVAFGWCLLGRFVQAIQFGVALVAVGGVFTITSVATADGIQLVAATGGDLLPGQLGALEGAYAYFAEALRLTEAPARALSLVLIMRGALVGVGVAGLVFAAVVPARERA